MKKYKFFVLILLITLMTTIGVNATTVDGDYSYTTYDNEGYDLITGEALVNDDMSRTNRVEISRNSIDDKIYFNDDDFSHVLFFNSSNIYIGYGNGNGSTRELSSFIGDVIPDGDDYYIEVPDNARKFALMNYNFGAFRNDIIYTNEDIDNIAWDSLSYRDIFEGNNLIVNSTFETTDNWFGTCGVFSSVDGVGFLDGQACAPTWQTFYQGPNTGMITNGNEYYISVDTLYPIYYDSFHISINQDIYWPTLLDYTNDITEMTNFADIFIAPDDSDYIYFIYDKGSVIVDGDDLYIDNVYLYDLTAIFTTNLPTIIEFETMKLYYDTYINAVDEISYNDIFNNNLVSNGGFDDAGDYWTFYQSTQVFGEGAVVSWNGVGTYYTAQQNIDVYDAHSYYYSIDLGRNGVEYLRFEIRFNSLIRLVDIISNPLSPYSGIYENNLGDRLATYFRVISHYDNISITIDNVNIYDLTAIFGYVEDDITTTWIEARYAEWVDPLASVYPNYYPASTLILNTIYYKYDDTPPAPADFQTSFDDKLVSIGVDTPQEELFGAFLIMIIVAVLLGLKFKSVAIVMIAELSLIFIFTVLGWFSLWFILVLALTFVLLILLKALKGGQK